MAQDSIPHKEAVFFNWQEKYMDVIVANSVSWGILSADVKNLQALQTIYTSSYTIGSKEQKLNRTTVQAKAFKVAEKNDIAGIRKFNAQWITKNPLVTDAQRVNLGVIVPDITKTRIGAMDFAPQFVVDKISVGEHRFRFSNPHSPNTKTMPKGQKIILQIAVGNANLPENRIPWVGTETVKKFLHTVHYTAGDKARTAYYSCCYESNRGERGPMSASINAVVA